MFRIFRSNEEGKNAAVYAPKQSNVYPLNDARREVIRHFRNNVRIIRELQLMNLQQIVRARISETWKGTSMTLRRITSLELI